MAVSLTSINVNGAAERHKRLRVFECLRNMFSDLFLLQETHLAEDLKGHRFSTFWLG